MNLVLANYFRRWWWVLALVAVFQIAMSAAPFGAGNMVPLFLPVFGGVFLLMLDTQRGSMRTLATLPVARSEMALHWWLATVILPPIATLVALLAGQLIRSFFTHKASFDLPWLGKHGGISFLISGTMFYAFAGLRPGLSGSLPERLKAGFFGALWGLSCGGSVFFAMSIGNWDEKTGPWTPLFLAATSLMTWLGWRDRETMALRKARTLRGQMAAEASTATAAQHSAPPGFGGFAFLLANTARSYLFFSLLMIGGMLVFGTLMTSSLTGRSAFDGLAGFLSAKNPGTIGIWLAVNCVALAPAMQIRGLRMLPVRAHRLALLVIGLPLCFCFLTTWVLHLFALLLAPEAATPAPWNRAAQAATLFALAVPVILRWGISPTTYGIAFGGLLAIFVASTPFTDQLPEYFHIGILLVVAPLAFLLTHRLISRSSAPYHGSLLKMPGWQMQS